MLRKDGTCFVNLGDTYGTISGTMGSDKWVQPKYPAANDVMNFCQPKASVPEKCLCLIPQRFVTMMIDGKYKPQIIQSEVDRAWLAAIIDGEGCVGIRWVKEKKYSDNYEPFIYVKVCDTILLERIIEITKIGSIREEKRKNRNPNHRPSYSWCVTGQQAATLAADIYPHIILKKNQCKIICELARRRKEGKQFKWTKKEEVAERHKLYETIKQYNQRKLTDDCGLPVPPQSRIGGGWILRNVIIWKKPNPMPSSAKDRFTVDFEYVYFFTKSRMYWFEQQFEPYAPNSDMEYRKTLRLGKFYRAGNQNPYKDNTPLAGDRKATPLAEGKNKRCVWSIPTQACPEAHFATFPDKLVEPMILAGCPEFVCKKCGKAREKIYDKGELVPDEPQYKPRGKNKPEIGVKTAMTPAGSKQGHPNFHYEQTFKGYTDCGCGEDWRPGVMLDPFVVRARPVRSLPN